MSFFSSVGGILGGVGSILGGLLGHSSANNANATNAAIAYDQLRFQKDYTKNRLQWQVEDAKKAGLHPMVAAGLSPTSFSPVSANQQPLDYSWVGDIGQNLDYAATKAKTNKQQAEAYNFQKVSNELQLDSLRLDNELKQMEIMSMLSRLVNTGPAAPDLNGKNSLSLIGGQDDSATPFMDKPIIRDGWLLDEKGRKISIIPSDALKGRTEDVLGVEWLPFIGSAYRDAKARIIGHEVNGHWWHGLDKGYLPYPPKSKGKQNVKVSSYYDNSYRY